MDIKTKLTTFLVLLSSLVFSSTFLKDTIKPTSYSNKLKCGFFLSYGVSNFLVKPSSSNSTNTLTFVSSDIAFNNIEIGQSFDWSLTNRISIRTGYRFFDEYAPLTFKKLDKIDKFKFGTVSLIIPFNFILQSKGNKTRSYIFFGPSFNVFNIPEKNSTNFYAKNFDIQADIGTGFHFRLKYIFISPEIRYSQGFINRYKKDLEFPYTESIKEVYRRNLFLVLNVSFNL